MEEWRCPPLDVLDDEREDHFEVYNQHTEYCLSLRTTENALRRFAFDRAILWMKANQRELLARETEAKKTALVKQFSEPIPTGIDGRNARAQVLTDFAWPIGRTGKRG